jgi:hypothetical protein
MKQLLLKSTLAAALVTASPAAVTYVDATSGAGGNTTLANGSTFTPPLNGTTGADNNWEQRTVFGSSGNIYEAGGENVTENAPELRTAIGGLTPGALYQVYAFFWDPTSNVEDWNMRAGTTSNAGANTLFTAPDATGELASTAAILASTLTFSTAPTLTLDAGRDLRAADLGTVTADVNGQIFVYVDDLPTSANVNRRTWYDGVGFEAVPEPSVSLLGVLGLIGLLRRRRP